MRKWCIVLSDGSVHYYYKKYLTEVLYDMFMKNPFSCTLHLSEFQLLTQDKTNKEDVFYLIDLYNRCTTQNEITDVSVIAGLIYTNQTGLPFEKEL